MAIWFHSLGKLAPPSRYTEAKPELELETIGASHYVEKVRWCLDRLGLSYKEQRWAGTLGVFYIGRSVPRLKVNRGAASSDIRNSSDILRYIWGRYGHSHEAEFLRPTQERIEWEEHIDICGRDLQRWIYFHILDDRTLTLRAWGVHDPQVPWWQRQLITAAFPVHRKLIRRAFKISTKNYEKSVAAIEALLEKTEQALADHDSSICQSSSVNYADISLAAISSLWLRPDEFGCGRFQECYFPDLKIMPTGFTQDRERWMQTYPLTVTHLQSLYTQRSVGTP